MILKYLIFWFCRIHFWIPLVKTSSYLGSFYYFDFYVFPLGLLWCSITRCLPVTMLSRRVAFTPPNAYDYDWLADSYSFVVYPLRVFFWKVALLCIFHVIIQMFFGKHNIIPNIMSGKCISLETIWKVFISRSRLVQNDLNSHTHLRVNLTAIN